MPRVPLSLPLWLASFAPILVLLLLLVWRRWTTAAAAPLGVFAAAAVAVLLLGTPPRTLAVASGKGIWDALFVLYVVWPSLLLYNVANAAGAFVSIQRGVRALMPDRLLVVLAFSWVLASFIQGIAGFGTPIAVTTPLLIGIGMKPVYAVLLPLIGASWGNVFGSLGVPWFATLAVVGVDDPAAAALQATLLLWIADLMAGLAITWIYGGVWALRRGLPAVLLISLLHGGLQLMLVPLLPSLGNFLATAAALAATLALSRWKFYRQLDEDEPRRIFTPEARTTFELRQAERQAQRRAARTEEQAGAERPPATRVASHRTAIPLPYAFAPYAVLSVLAVVALMLPPVRQALEGFSVGLPFPATTTEFRVRRPAEAAYSAFTPLTHPGTILLLSAVATFALYRVRGYLPRRATPGHLLARTASAALPATTAITALLLISALMDHSGQIEVLALGISTVAPELVFVGASNFIGVLGTLLTSSSTASNVLFAPLQESTAAAYGIAEELVVAAQVTGAAVGGAVAPGDILLGAAVAGATEVFGAVLAKAIPWALVTGLLVSAATLAMALLG